jgi:hypothetical protein
MPKVSPSARYVAGGISIKGRRLQLAVLDVENLGRSKVGAGGPSKERSLRGNANDRAQGLGEESNKEWRPRAPVPFGLLPKTRLCP